MGAKGLLNFPFCDPSKKTWKHNLTALRSMLVGCLLCSKPAAIIHLFITNLSKLMKKYYNICIYI